MHARLKPKIHRFSYNVFSTVIDLDRYQEANKSSQIFSINKRNLLSFHEKDHGPRDGSSLRSHIDLLFDDGGIQRPDKVLLWCNPRVLGYTFNPLSVYFCYDKHGDVTALVYQVHNTFGQDHSYVAIVNHGEDTGASIRQTTEKKFYVSPFLDMDLRYDFRINQPAEDIRIRILEHDADGPILSATFSGEYAKANTKNLLSGVCKTIGLTWKIVAGIHFEAIFLWAKGVKLRKRPEAPDKTSYLHRKNIVAGE